MKAPPLWWRCCLPHCTLHGEECSVKVSNVEADPWTWHWPLQYSKFKLHLYYTALHLNANLHHPFCKSGLNKSIKKKLRNEKEMPSNMHMSTCCSRHLDCLVHIKCNESLKTLKDTHKLRDTTSVNLIPASELSENVLVILSESNAFHL